MRLSLAIAIVAVLGPTMANPVEGRAAKPHWSVSNFSFCKDESPYTYSFDIQGRAAGHTPAFSGTCSGTNGKVFLQCTSTPSGKQLFNLFAKTKITTVPGEPKDRVPEVTVQTVQIVNGCEYTRTGKKIVVDATCGSTQGSEFKIDPFGSKVC